jgi:hypothetical protein
MEEENNKVESSVKHLQHSHNNAIQTMEKIKADKLHELNKAYEGL